MKIRWIGGFWNVAQTPAVNGPPVDFFEFKTQETKQELKQALSTSAKLERTLTGHSELEELRAESTRLHCALLTTARQAPESTGSLPELAGWCQEVEDQCYAIEALEQQISLLMDNSRSVLSMDDTELLKYGNKHANNVKQARVAQALDIPGVVVPLPHGINSDTVQRFLKTQAPEIFEHWSALGELYNEASPFLEQPQAKAHLAAIEKGIEGAFSMKGAFDALELPVDLISWLDEVKASGNYLMVRSTGKGEDTRQTANAGGNVSKAYVSPDHDSFCKAAGEVIRSNFGYASLQNRINAGLNPFAEEPGFAVTAQQLIGEPIGGAHDPEQIPISLVLFTDEPLYSGGESFRVMRISATYGHGEGVVGNMGIASDTVTLLVSDAHPDELYVLYDNQAKPFRLAPVETAEGIQLGKVPNPPELRDRPTLSPEMLARLYHWGIIGEKFFDDAATDMEIVTKGNTIYPVQARPVNRPMMLPTYLDMHKIAAEPTTPIIRTLQAEGLVPGKASVVLITDPTQIRTATTLEKAQGQFKKDMHQLVIVEQPEPANSHPIVNFSSLGIPCLIVKDKKAMDAMIAGIDEDHPLVVCMQTGTLHQWDSSKGEVDAFTSHGFTVHPAKIALSLPVQKRLPVATTKRAVPQEIKDFIIAIRSATSQEVALQNLEELKQHPFVDNITKGKESLLTQLADREIVSKEAAEVSGVIESFDSKLTRAFQETEAAIRHQTKGERLKPLLQVKVLESLLIGSPKQSGAIGQYSVLDITPATSHTQEIIDYQASLPHPAHFADVLLEGHQALTTEGSREWAALLRQLEPLVEQGTITQEQVGQFKGLIQTLQDANALSQWFTFTFPTVDQKNLSAEQKLQALSGSLSPKDAMFVQQQLHSLQAIRGFRDHIDRFSSPDTYQQAWKDLQHYASPKAQSALAEQMKVASPTARMIALNTMKEIVDKYDLAIKALKTGSQSEEKAQIAQFKAMLFPYLDLLTSWHKEGVVTPGTIPPKAELSIEEYFLTLRRMLQTMPDDQISQLQPSPNFSVLGAMLGCLTPLSYHLPAHLEDMFTLIHQNLLGAIAAINNEDFSPDVLAIADIPPTMKSAMDSVSKRHPNRVGVEVSETGLEVKYNVPLHFHSGQLSLIYDKNDDSLKLIGNLMGHNGGDRWRLLANASDLMSDLGILESAAPTEQNEQGLTVTWRINDDSSLQDAMDVYNALAQYTIQPTAPPLIDKLFSICKGRGVDFANAIMSCREGSTRILANMVIVDASIDTALPKVREAFQSSDQKLKTKALDALINFVDYWYGQNRPWDHSPPPSQVISMSLELLDEGLSDSSPMVRAKTLELINQLVIKQAAPNQALEVAIKGIGDPASDIRRAAASILTSLLKQGTVPNDVPNIIHDRIRDSDPQVRQWARNYLLDLIRKNRDLFPLPIDDITFAVSEGSIDSDANVRYASIDLAREMGMRIEGIETVAIRGINDSDIRVREKAFFMLSNLIYDGKALDSTLQVIQKGIPNTQVMSSDAVTMELVRGLAGKVDYEVIRPFLLRGFSSSDWAARKITLEICKGFISKGHVDETIREIIQKSTNDTNREVQVLAEIIKIPLETLTATPPPTRRWWEFWK